MKLTWSTAPVIAGRPDMASPDVRERIRETVTALAGAHMLRTLESKSKPVATVALTSWMTPALAERLRDHPDARVRERLARNKACPTDVLLTLLEDQADEVRTSARNNPNTPYDRAVGAGMDPLDHVDCPGDVLADAVYSAVALPAAEHYTKPVEAVLNKALVHPRLPDDARARALDLDSLLLLGRLLWNPSTTEPEAVAVLKSMAHRGGHYRLVEVERWAGHPNATSEWLAAEYARDTADGSGTSLVNKIARHRSTPHHVLEHISAQQPQYLASNPAAPTYLLHRARTWADACSSNDRAAQVRRDLALNPASDSSLLSKFDAFPTIAGLLRYEFALAHGTAIGGHITTVDQAELVCRMAPQWTGNLADLIYTAGDLAI